MNELQFTVLSGIIQDRRGPKTAVGVVEKAFHFINGEKGDRNAKRYAARMLKARDELEATGGDIIELANLHADMNGAVTDNVFDAAIESLTDGVSVTKSALKHQCYSASVYNFVRCIEKLQAAYKTWMEVK